MWTILADDLEVWKHQMRKAVREGRMCGKCLEDSIQEDSMQEQRPYHYKGVRINWGFSSSSFPSLDLVA